MTMMLRSTKVQLVPLLPDLYFDVNVVEPAVRPVRKYVALRCGPAVLSAETEWVSDTATVLAPDPTKLMKHKVPLLPVVMPAVRMTRAWPLAPMVTVTAGPEVARSV
jgi:hypothetical protein